MFYVCILIRIAKLKSLKLQKEKWLEKEDMQQVFHHLNRFKECSIFVCISTFFFEIILLILFDSVSSGMERTFSCIETNQYEITAIRTCPGSFQDYVEKHFFESFIWTLIVFIESNYFVLLDLTLFLQIFAEFRREATFMQSLRHKNIVSLHAIVVDPFCLVLEFMNRGNLYEFIHKEKVILFHFLFLCSLFLMSLLFKDKHQNVLANENWNCFRYCRGISFFLSFRLSFSFSPTFTKQNWQKPITLSLCSFQGMNYLHSIHFIHRDLKSPNVLLADDPLREYGISAKVRFWMFSLMKWFCFCDFFLKNVIFYFLSHYFCH